MQAIHPKNNRARRVDRHPIARQRRSVQSVVLTAARWLFTRTGEEGKPLLALLPRTDNDDYPVVTFLVEATRQQI
jgi:hypothetical protein